MLIAGVMILLLLILLAFVDAVNAPEEHGHEVPRFSETVPVRKREMVQPVKESAVVDEEAPAPPEPAEPEESALPVDRTVTTAGHGAAPAGRSAQQPSASPRTDVAPRTAGSYSFDVGSFTQVGDAEHVAARLAAEGFAVRLETHVRVGPFRTRADAEAARRRLKSLGVETPTLLSAGGRR